MRTLYEILGLSPDADTDQVRSAYRARVKEVHPDAGGSNEAFSEVVIAYEILIDEQRRTQYDDTGSLEDSSKSIIAGAKLIVQGLIEDLVQRDDAKYLDVVTLFCANISRSVSAKSASIDGLEKRWKILVDLKDRFRAESAAETYVHELLEQRMEATRNAISAERLSIAQFNAASALLRRYNFIREYRPTNATTSHIDVSVFGRTVDPLLDTAEFSSRSRKT